MAPAVHGGVIDGYAALGHHLLDVTQAQRIGCVPAHAREHHLQRVVPPLDHLAQCREHHRSRPVVKTGGRLPALAYCDGTKTSAPRFDTPMLPAPRRVLNYVAAAFRLETCTHGPRKNPEFFNFPLDSISLFAYHRCHFRLSVFG